MSTTLPARLGVDKMLDQARRGGSSDTATTAAFAFDHAERRPDVGVLHICAAVTPAS